MGPVTAELQCSDGSWLRAEVQSYGARHLGPATLAITVREILQPTDRHQPEAPVDHLLAAILDALPAMVSVVDHQGRYMAVNRHFCDASGLPADAILGKATGCIEDGILDQICHSHSTDKPSVDNPVAGNQSADSPGRDDPLLQGPSRKQVHHANQNCGDLRVHSQRVTDRHGRERWWSTAKTPYFDRQGQSMGSVFVITDITDLKNAEAKRLAEMKHGQDQLVRQIHHRIKNHLQGLVSQLRLQTLLEPATRSALDVAIAQALTLALVYELQGQHPAGLVDLQELVRRLVQTAGDGANINWQPRADNRGIMLESDEAVPVAGVIKEILVRAGRPDTTGRPPVELSLRLAGNRVGLVFAQSQPEPNRPGAKTGQIPSRDQEQDKALKQIRNLLPARGAELRWHREHCCDLTELWLSPPLIAALPESATSNPASQPEGEPGTF